MKKNDSIGKVNKILSSIDDDTLQKGIDKLKGMSDSESAKLKKQLDGIDKQICGGPHVKNTGELGQFVIKKEESSSSGVRRIKAILKQYKRKPETKMEKK